MKSVFYALTLITSPAFSAEPYMWGVGPSVGFYGSTGPDQMSVGMSAVAQHKRHLQFVLDADLLVGSTGLGLRSLLAVESVWPTSMVGLSLGGAAGVERQFRRHYTGARQKVTAIPVHLRVGLYGSWDIYRVGMVLYGGPSVPVRTIGSMGGEFGPRIPVQFGTVIRVYWGDFTPPRKPRFFDETGPKVDDKID